MTIDYEALRARLDKHGQSHLLAFWHDLDEAQRTTLAKQINSIDFAALQRALDHDVESEDWGALANRSSSPAAIRLDGSGRRIDQAQAKAAGEAALRDGRVAVILVAGGQGTRLGFDHPKGMYPIGPVSKRTLFEIHVDQLRAIERRYQVTIPFFLMTSPATHEETIRYFQANGRLGLTNEQLTIFCQGTMPAVDAATGQLLLDNKGSLSLSPNGHGGTLAALADNRCLEMMEANRIDYLFYFQVDNPLVAIASPSFIGNHILANSELTTQVVAKMDPLERVGNVVEVDGHLHIIEYSDLPDEAAQRRNPDGSLTIWAGNIAVHAFNTAFLRRMAGDSTSLPWHKAVKKVPYLEPTGQRVSPQSPNAIKLERFIFDLLPSAENALVVEVSERDAFAPLKNGTGAAKDTPETCQAAMVDLHRRWMRAADVAVDNDVVVEINPNFALDAEDVKEKLHGQAEAVKRATYYE